MDLIETNFATMCYNVRSIPDDQDPLEHFKPLQVIFSPIPPVYNGISRNSIVRYVLFMYDIGTPLRSAIPEVMRRKFYAASLAGFETKKNKFIKPVEEILVGKDEVVNRAIVEFVVSIHSASYTKLVAFENALQGCLMSMMKGSLGKNAIDDINSLESEINTLTGKLLQDDKTQFIVDKLYEKIATDKLELRPEDIADKLAAGEEPVDIHPYGEKYNFEPYPWRGVELSSDTEVNEK